MITLYTKKTQDLDHVFIKKEYPYNNNENKHKIHLSDREINTIHTVNVATFLGIKWIQHGVFILKFKHKHPQRPSGCESISSQGRRAPGDIVLQD